MSKSLTAIKLNETKSTPQTRKAEKGQKRNNAGGFSFKVSDADRFRRFLTIGTDGGTYYVGESELTEKEVAFVQKYIDKAGTAAVEEIVNVSSNALAPKNSQALFALAVAFKSEDLAVKAAAKAALSQVARTSTHLFEFAQYLENIAGWGRAKKSAVAAWYTDKATDQLAYQAVKYRQRNGWTHRDLLRLSHPQGLDSNVVNWILGKPTEGELPQIIQTFEALQNAKSEKEVLAILKANKNAPWELIPTEFHKSAKIWEQLFRNGMGQTALLRNTTRFAKLGLFDDMVLAADYAKALTDKEAIHKGRVHPINYLNASIVFSQGRTPRGESGYWGYGREKDWTTNRKVSAALDKGYELAFKNIVPAEKRTFVALDVSGSMASKASGLELSCAQVTGAMANMIAKTEPYSIFRGFTSGGYGYSSRGSSGLTDLGIDENDSLATVSNKISGKSFGGTDCSLPMVQAKKENLEVDTFIVMTDNETYAGSAHPHQALEAYRKASGIDAKLVVVAATSTRFTIADASDGGMLDMSGFDSSSPAFIADFSAGRV